MRHLLLIVLFIFAQLGALAHGVTHLPDQANGDDAPCVQCLAYAPMGAAAASSPPVWLAADVDTVFDAPLPATFLAAFQAIYRSRAPPRLLK